MWHSLGDLVATIKGAPQYLLAFTSQGLSSLFHPLARERFNHEGLEHWRGESEEGLDGTANITRTLQHSFQAEYRALEALEDSCQELERRVDRLSEAENLILIDALVREEEFDVTDRQLLSVTRRSVSLLPNLSHAHEVTSTQRAGYGELRSNISQLLRVSRDEKQQGSKDTAQATNKEPHSYETSGALDHVSTPEHPADCCRGVITVSQDDSQTGFNGRTLDRDVTKNDNLHLEKMTQNKKAVPGQSFKRILSALCDLFPWPLREILQANQERQIVTSAALENSDKSPTEHLKTEPECSKPMVDCVLCMDTFLAGDSAMLACGHYWCHPCLQQGFEKATTEESCWPAKCCDEISGPEIRHALNEDVLNRYLKKSKEWGSKNRTYCHSTICAQKQAGCTFIDPETITWQYAKCPDCGLLTCTDCKGPLHADPCPTDNETLNGNMESEKFRQAAKLFEWSSCPTCSMTIEITSGCNHITCPCKTNYCYICSKKWKTCACPNQTEPAVRSQRINERMKALSDDEREAMRLIAAHARCEHPIYADKWRRVSHDNTFCEICDQFVPENRTVFECPYCFLRICCDCQHRNFISFKNSGDRAF